MNFVSVMSAGTNLLLWALTVIAGVAALVALVHAATQRKDAFPAVDKLSKGLWVTILVVATLLIWFGTAPSFLYIIGVVALIVYLVDVRPRVDAIQGKRWFSKRA